MPAVLSGDDRLAALVARRLAVLVEHGRRDTGREQCRDQRVPGDVDVALDAAVSGGEDKAKLALWTGELPLLQRANQRRR